MLRIHDILGWIWIRIRIRGSMPLTNGSGSWIRILLFSSLTFKMPAKNNFFLHTAYYFLKVHLHHFSKIKSLKESQNSRNRGLSYYFCMMIEGSGSGRPKNMWIRWIRIRNTDGYASRQWRRFTSKYFYLLTAHPHSIFRGDWWTKESCQPEKRSGKKARRSPPMAR